MLVESYTPRVFVAKELREISRDFTRPEEIVRESIANSLDAGASKIGIYASVIETEYGEEQLIVELSDDGVGMNLEELKSFFDLGKSTKRANVDAIGEKGHGTKIFYNSKEVLVLTKYLVDGKIFKAVLKEPLGKLNRAVKLDVDEPPIIEIEEIQKADNYLDQLPSGTYIQIKGYDGNVFSTFSHEFLKDYILWFTAWGSLKPRLGIDTLKNQLFLKGIGIEEPVEIPFGHPFPEEISDFAKLKEIDARRPENYFVKSWIIKNRSVIKYPQHNIDIIFYVEGDGAKRHHNRMLKRVGKSNQEHYRSEDQYTVSDRYGIYLCKDFIAIQRKNEEFAERSEWTKWHAFINCQSFGLTANRANVDNTSKELLQKIMETAQRAITEDIISTDDYQNFSDRAKIEAGRRKAELERKKVSRRIKSTKEKLKFKITKDEKILEFLEPRTEQGVIWLLAQIVALWPNTFNWKVLDIDSHFGFDLLVEQPHLLTNAPDNRFVECKLSLGSEDFNHSYMYLHQIVCWETGLQDSDEITDIQGKNAVFQVYQKNQQIPYRRHFLDEGKQTKIEVIVLRRFLEDCFNLTN